MPWRQEAGRQTYEVKLPEAEKVQAIISERAHQTELPDVLDNFETAQCLGVPGPPGEGCQRKQRRLTLFSRPSGRCRRMPLSRTTDGLAPSSSSGRPGDISVSSMEKRHLARTWSETLIALLPRHLPEW